MFHVPCTYKIYIFTYIIVIIQALFNRAISIAIKDVVFDIANVYAPSGDGTERTNFYTTV